ncbi:hypothetical protein ES703_103750 [subsurface metagenome]
MIVGGKRKWNYFKSEFDPSTVGILLTSHPRQQLFWNECLPSWDNSPYFVLLGYDDVDIERIKKPLSKFSGIKEVFVTGTRHGHLAGELQQLKMGFEILYNKGFHYVLKLAADFRVGNLDGIEYLWEALESKKFPIPGDATLGAQVIGDQTAWMFGFAGILHALFRNFNHHTKRGGSAELFYMRHRRSMNVTMTKLPMRIFDILDMLHVQGQYARDNKMTIQQTWDVGEVW